MANGLANYDPKVNIPCMEVVAGQISVHTDSTVLTTTIYNQQFTAAKEATGVIRVTLKNGQKYPQRPMLHLTSQPAATTDYSLRCVDPGALVTGGSSSAAPTAGSQFDIAILDTAASQDTPASPGTTAFKINFIAVFQNSAVV